MISLRPPANAASGSRGIEIAARSGAGAVRFAVDRKPLRRKGDLMTSGNYDPNAYEPSQGYRPSAGGTPGGLGVRFAARVIDGVIVAIISWVLAATAHASSSILVTGLFSGLLMFAYFVGFEVSQGWTVGKKILGLSVHGPGGAPKPTVQQSAIRNSFTLLTVIPFIGGLLALIAYIVIAVTISGSPTKQGKHDELAGGTQVLKS